jgi:hypothetical protein
VPRGQRDGYLRPYFSVFKTGAATFLSSSSSVVLGRKSSGSGLESLEYGRRDPSRWPRGTLYPQNFALTSLTSGGRSVDTVR